MQVQPLHKARSEDRRIGGAGKKEKQEVQEEWAPVDQGKKLRQRGGLIFRKEGTKGFIERLALWSDVVN